MKRLKETAWCVLCLAAVMAVLLTLYSTGAFTKTDTAEIAEPEEDRVTEDAGTGTGAGIPEQTEKEPDPGEETTATAPAGVGIAPHAGMQPPEIIPAETTLDDAATDPAEPEVTQAPQEDENSEDPEDTEDPEEPEKDEEPEVTVPAASVQPLIDEPVDDWDRIREEVGDFVIFTYYYHVGAGRYYSVGLSPELQRHTWRMCVKYNVPYKIVMGLMGVESGWTADIGVYYDGTGGYVGLGMLSEYYCVGPFAARGIDIYTPEGNIEGICSTLSEKFIEFGGNVHHALMAYNAGSGGAYSMIAKGMDTSSYSEWVCGIADHLVTDMEYAVGAGK